MGIRFRCPNGHPLNVKDEFAGKRAICPKCEAKLVVPAAATSEAATDSEPATVDVAPEAAQPVHSDDSAASAPPPAPPVDDVWHVRIASGEQFGPVDLSTVQAWIKEGRVAASAWVWRAGWDDWKPGSEAIALLAGQADAAPAEPLPTPAEPPAATSSAEADETPLGGDIPTSPAAARRKKLAQRKQRQMKVTLVLVVLTLVLAVVLAMVLLRQPAKKEPDPQSGRPVRNVSSRGENLAFKPLPFKLRW